MKTARRRAREFAVQALYQAALNQSSAAEVTQNIRESSDFAKADEPLFTAIFFGAHANQRDYMQQIRPLLDRDEPRFARALLSPYSCPCPLSHLPPRPENKPNSARLSTNRAAKKKKKKKL